MARKGVKGKLAATRVAMLVEQLKRDRPELESQAELANDLGLGETTLSKILSNGRGAGMDTVEKIVSKKKIDREFFLNPSLVDPHYRDYPDKGGMRTVQIRPQTKGWQEFVELGLVEKFRQLGLDDEQIEYLERAKFVGGASSAQRYINLAKELLGSPVEQSAQDAIKGARAKRGMRG